MNDSEAKEQEMEKRRAFLEQRANENASTPTPTDPSRIISPVDQAALGLAPHQDPPSVLILSIQYKVAGRPGQVLIENAGKTDWSFQQGSNKEQVLAMLGVVAEWCRSVPGVEVEYLVKEGE